MKVPAILQAVVLSLFMSAGAAFSISGETLPGKYKGYNVILIIADALRPDYLGRYNPEKKTSPRIDAIAGQSIVFDGAFCQMPITLPSVSSIFTSTDPLSHNVRHVFKDNIPDTLPTLAEVLQLYGYSTAWFGVPEDPHTGGNKSLMRGFEHSGRDDTETRQKKGILRFIREINFGYILRWIRDQKRRPFFMTVHTYVTHEKHYPRSRFSDEFARKLKPGTQQWCKERMTEIVEEMMRSDHLWEAGAQERSNLRPKNTTSPVEFLTRLREQSKQGRYKINGFFWQRMNGALLKPDAALYNNFLTLLDSAVFELDDKLIGKLMRVLARKGFSGKTIIIITADHGNEYREHGLIGHGSQLYDESIHVPLIVHIPGRENPGRIDSLVQSIDIMPTILDLLGIPFPYQTQGKSLVPLMTGSTPKVYDAVFMQSIDGKFAVRNKEWKYIQNTAASEKEDELYNLREDPHERRNRIRDRMEVAENLRRQLEEWKKSLPVYGNTKGEFLPWVDEEARERIRKTGYW